MRHVTGFDGGFMPVGSTAKCRVYHIYVRADLACEPEAAAPFGGAAIRVGAAGGVVALDVDQVEVADGGQHVPRRPRQRQALRRRRAARLRRA